MGDLIAEQLISGIGIGVVMVRSPFEEALKFLCGFKICGLHGMRSYRQKMGRKEIARQLAELYKRADTIILLPHYPFPASLTQKQRGQLVRRLWQHQAKKDYVSGEPIDLQVHEVDLDDVIALSGGGPDDESNIGLALAHYNRSKGCETWFDSLRALSEKTHINQDCHRFCRRGIHCSKV